MVQRARSGRSPRETVRVRSRSGRRAVVGAVLLALLLPAPVVAAEAPVLEDGGTNEKVVALTIDDGYRPDLCVAMANVLREKGATATFFPVVRNVENSPRPWKRIARDFPVANHTMFHAILPPLDERTIRKQISSGRRVLERILGEGAANEFRAPGGSTSPLVREIVRDEGYRRISGWDTTTADTSLNGKASGMIRNALRGGRGSIILMHCNREVSLEILPAIIDGYRARGFRFVTITELFDGPSAAGPWLRDTGAAPDGTAVVPPEPRRRRAVAPPSPRRFGFFRPR